MLERSAKNTMQRATLILTCINTLFLIYLFTSMNRPQEKRDNSVFQNHIHGYNQGGSNDFEATTKPISQEDFSVEDLNDEVRRASAILIVKFERKDQRIIALIDKILYVQEGCGFQQSVNDEFHHLSHDYKDDHNSGEGAVVFLNGHSNPSFQRSSNIHNSKVNAYNNMSVKEVITLIETSLQNKSQ
jgi:hypothetical protein